MTFRELIKSEMDAQKMKPGTLARLSGVDSGNVWRFLNDEYKGGISLRTSMKLMRTLKISCLRLEEVTFE